MAFLANSQDMAAWPRLAIDGLMQWVWPRRCIGCGEPFSERNGDDDPTLCGYLCAACSPSVMSGTEHCCPTCGLVWLDPPPADGLAECGPCLQRPPRFARARARFAYGGAIQHAIQRWKNAGEESLGPALARLLVADVPSLGARRWPADTVVVPMPSPWRRVWSRGFNPAGVLARQLARQVDLPLVLGLRLKRTIPKARGMDRRARARRVRGVFAARPVLVRGRPIVLVDDVMTTGATAEAAAGVLRRAGARFVDVVALARVAW